MSSTSSSSDAETKVCLLTGASGTIGYAIAKALHASSSSLSSVSSSSWHIILIGRRPPQTFDCESTPPYDAFLEVTDLTNESVVVSTLNTHFNSLKNSTCVKKQSLDRLDLLINCAGCSLGNNPIVDVSAETLRQVMEVNLIVPYILSRWAMSKMATSIPSGGRIINIGSIACESPRLHSVPYTTSKYALSGLTRALSIEGRNLSKTTKCAELVGGGCGGVVAVCQINPGNVRSAIMSAEEAARREREEGFVDADDIGKYVAMVANLPNETNVLESTVMPTRQPLVGRGCVCFPCLFVTTYFLAHAKIPFIYVTDDLQVNN